LAFGAVLEELGVFGGDVRGPDLVGLERGGELVVCEEGGGCQRWSLAVDKTSLMMRMREVAYGCVCMTRGRSDRGVAAKWWRAGCMGAIAQL
jgi:hypothetical protein